MSDHKPLVTVGMPVYNEARWIRQALDALLSQTFKDFELIVSDNASTDGTWDILQEYAEKDPRISIHHQLENRGAENWWFVLDQAQGDYFMWASGHDLWSSNLLEVLVGELQTNPEAVLSAPGAVLIGEDDSLITNFNEAIDTRIAKSAAGRVLAMHQQIKRCNAFYGLHRRSILRQVLPWPKVVGNDFIILVRLACLGDIITNESAQWFRRRNRPETHRIRIQRYVSVHQLSGFPAIFPYLVGRVTMVAEFLKAEGSYYEKISLLGYSLRKLFLAPGQPQLLIKEFFAGSSALIHYVWQSHFAHHR